MSSQNQTKLRKRFSVTISCEEGDENYENEDLCELSTSTTENLCPKYKPSNLCYSLCVTTGKTRIFSSEIKKYLDKKRPLSCGGSRTEEIYINSRLFQDESSNLKLKKKKNKNKKDCSAACMII